MRWLLGRSLFWFVLLVVAATLLNMQALRQAEDKVEAVAAREALTNYENQIAGCHRSNPVRVAVVTATQTAAEVATKGNSRYAASATRILEAPHIRPNGSVICKEAIDKP